MTRLEDSPLTVERACQISGVSRAGYYRAWRESEPQQVDMELRNRIHQICLENRLMGTRRVTAALRQQGCPVGRKLVQRLMREDNLLALRKRGSLVTTNSRHTYGVYNNLIRNFRATGANQLWVADITYIRLRQQFVYLAVILDAWSRRVIGWELGETLEAQLTVAALRKAIADRAPQAGVIHHSDRGIQYCAAVYVQILNEAGFLISMSRAGSPQDNALAESFMRTFKCEEVYLTKYRDLDEARERITEFLDDYYNRRRLHSSLGYISPLTFEEAEA